jgi:hypothetical protein
VSIEAAILDLQARVAALETLPGGAATGVWTPAWVGTGTAGVYTYNVQAGVYTRLGKLVYAQAFISITAIGTPPVGNMTISGLPYAAEAGNTQHSLAIGYLHAFNYTAAAMQLTGIVNPGLTTINLYESFDAGAVVQVPAANFTSTTVQIIFSTLYRVT